jgi:HEAT repeat protein
MESISSALTSFALHAAMVWLGTIFAVLAFIVSRRYYRSLYFKRLDSVGFAFRGQWEELLSFRIDSSTWRSNKFKRAVVERIALDALATSADSDCSRIQEFIRRSGLVEKRLWEASAAPRHQRREALLIVGRTRLPEVLEILSQAAECRDPLIQDAAIRGLGYMGSAQAGVIILQRLAAGNIKVSQLALKDALLRCCRNRPDLLLPYLNLDERTHLFLSRILGEVATPGIADDLALLARDPDPEIRASSARGLAYAEPLFAIAVLSELAMDEVWFVRLRAIVSLAKFGHPASLPALLATICDVNRIVRQRSASALAQLPKELLPVIVDRVANIGDKYALHALISELERIGECSGLMLQLSDKQALTSDSGRNLLRAVEEARRQIEAQRTARQVASEATASHA